ncbi:MAG TPA: hypothetical protein VFZ65_13920, partial [Planctomycetota bacterium]|nr:hypothetical protein [Planctomycetota bacterium]
MHATPSAVLLTTLALTASAARAQHLVAVDSNRALYSIDIVTAQKVQFGTISANAGTPGELVHDAATGVTFLTSTNTAS